MKSFVTVHAFKDHSGKSGLIILTDVLSVYRVPDSILDASATGVIGQWF